MLSYFKVKITVFLHTHKVQVQVHICSFCIEIDPFSYPWATCKVSQRKTDYTLDPLSHVGGCDAVASCLSVSHVPCTCSWSLFSKQEITSSPLSVTPKLSLTAHTQSCLDSWQSAWVQQPSLGPVWDEVLKKANEFSLCLLFPLPSCTLFSLWHCLTPQQLQP